jgi:hypothetical protein
MLRRRKAGIGTEQKAFQGVPGIQLAWQKEEQPFLQFRSVAGIAHAGHGIQAEGIQAQHKELSTEIQVTVYNREAEGMAK